MDAQNATEADQSKSAAAPRRRSSVSESKRPSKITDRRLTASPEAKATKLKAVPALPKPDEDAEADPDERDSDAETIVLPGKDGHSPSKIRKMRQDDKNEKDGEGVVRHSKSSLGNGADKAEVESKPADTIKRRRLSASAPRDKSQLARNKDGSSGLSSAPASPPRDKGALHRRRRSNASPHRSSDSEAANRAASGRSLHDRFKSSDRLASAKRKAPRTDSDEEDDHRKARRQRTTSISIDAARPRKDRSLESRNRSHSPPSRMHRRSASTQLAHSSSGLSQKKRRLPPPLQSTEQASDDSDRSGSPLPRSSKLRSLATPATADSNVSPAKIMPHKKHLDAHGQTFLARACARGEYDYVKKRLGERPEDINVADYAGNTPLQIAAINGCEDIVKLLIEAGCNMDCVNYDKDTPLLDAVDNGHLGVVKLLVDAGVNPRKANVSGQEPIDRITDETENADEIRTLLEQARKRAGERRRTSEDRHSHPDYYEGRDSHAPDSPRHSPAMAPSGGTGRRGGTVRATKTRNDLLYMPLDDKTLRQAAGRGDEETVARILQVKEGYNDPESMVAAARGGHDLVIQLLLGLGSANPDPGPVSALQPEFATPILAAIGQENIKVVELLLEQGGFDPTRRFKGDTYYEIARKRQGTNWKEEETLLKNAYDEYKRSHKDGAKPGKSPGRRERDREREEKRARREEASRDEARAHKRNHSSPNRDSDSRKKSAPQKLTSPKERRRLEPGRHIKEDRTSSTHTSDRETSPAVSHKTAKSKNRDTDAAVSSDGEALKPRRKLVSKGELRGERDKHRRSSMASNASSLKEPSSPQDPRNEDTAPEKSKVSEKYHDRTKALKREESKDPSATGSDGHAKRHRSSVTPDGQNHADKDESAIPQKRRRLDADGQEKRSKQPTSPETRHSKLSAAKEGSKSSGKASRKSIEDDSTKDAKDNHVKRDQPRKDATRTAANESSVRVKSEDVDVQMPDAESAEATAAREQQDKKKKELAEQELAKKEEERQRADAKKEEERKLAEAEEAKKREEEEAKRREAAEKARLEQEEQQRLDEKKRKEDEEQRRKQEEERKRQEAEQKREEEARKKQEDEERQRREQLEREAADAADAARRKREEDQRRERERRERVAREELEKKRAAREAEQRRVREEQEKARLDKLPPLMRWLDLHPNPKTRAVAERFCQVQGCRYDTIDSATNGTPEGRDEWVLNTAVALLLGEKDLTLSRYSAWEHIPVSDLAKETIWRTEWMQYSLASQQYFDLGREVPGLYPKEPTDLTPAEKEELKKAAWERFSNLPMFFVKVSEVLYTVPQIPHLQDVTIGVGYRELQEPEGSSSDFKVVSKQFRYLAKHLSDPHMERYHGRAPRWRWYLNGNFIEEDLPRRAITSNLPFNERPVPRRGLVAVNPDDPDYFKICREQGITPVVKGQPSPTLTNGTRDSVSTTATSHKHNGVNGTIGSMPSPEDPAKARHALNGINGTSQEVAHES